MKPSINKETEALLNGINQKNEEEILNYSSNDIDSIEMAIVSNNLEISHVVIQKHLNRILFVLNNGTLIERNLTDIHGLQNATEIQLNNYENIGIGILWNEISSADTSLHGLIEEELYRKFKLKVA